MFTTVFIHLQITLPYEATQLSKATRSTAAIYLACGIDSSKVCFTYLYYAMFLCACCGWLSVCWRFYDTLCVSRPPFLYNLMSVLILSWCGYWVLQLLLVGSTRWFNSKRSHARRCVIRCTIASLSTSVLAEYLISHHSTKGIKKTIAQFTNRHLSILWRSCGSQIGTFAIHDWYD